MLTERRDYILRLIQEAGAAARRLRELLSAEGADATVVVRDADTAIATLLGGGSQAPLLERVDADTAVRLLGDAERVRVWIDLLHVQAAALSGRGAHQESQRVRGRAGALSDAADRLAASSGS